MELKHFLIRIRALRDLGMLVHFLEHELHINNAHDLVYRKIVDDDKLGRNILNRANSLAHRALKHVDCGELVPACKVVTFPRQ